MGRTLPSERGKQQGKEKKAQLSKVEEWEGSPPKSGLQA